jgi:hypothetical protein
MATNVEVNGNTVMVEANEVSPSVWIAVGDYLGKRIEVKADSHAAVLTLWQQTAEYRGR